MSLSLDDSTVPQNGLLSIEDTHEQQPTAQDSEPLLFSLNEGINIVTHNIRGLSQLAKLQSWIDFAADSNMHIISLTETKLTESRSKGLSNPKYFIYTSNFQPTLPQQREASLGTALMICRPLQPYIHNIQTLPGTAILIDLFFPGKNRLRVISTYLPSNHPTLNKKTQERILSWYREAKSRNWNVLILGDFNANPSRDKKYPLFVNLHMANATSLLQFHAITTPTWSNSTSSSQIDDIWCDSDILLDLDPPTILDATHITDSDHRILITKWHTTITPHRTPRNKRKKRKIYHYNKMKPEDWETFANQVNEYFNKHPAPPQHSVWDPPLLNKTWNRWTSELKKLINENIPFTYSAPKTYYALSLKETKLHTAIKTLNKCLRHLTSASQIDLPLVNNLLAKTNKLSDIVITPLQTNDINNSLQSTIQQLKQIKQTIWTARNLEKQMEQNKRIDSFVNKRYADFSQNTSRMIDSILQKRTEVVRTDKIILPDQIITDRNEIKQHIRSHFSLWTKHNPPLEDLKAEWEETYSPIKKIDPTIYDLLSQAITLEELTDTISNAPRAKATGPNLIANEILQHLPRSALNFLLLIFNKCLELNIVPEQWLKANIWPIPKKPKYNYDLHSTRPITLIDHTRKIFTKILTQRITSILQRYQVLSPLNFAAFPYQSTIQPVSQLTHILEDTVTSKKEIWVLSQDMSKAFDSVHIPTLTLALKRIKLPQSTINLLTFLLSHRTNRVITDTGLTEPYAVLDGIDQGETFSPVLWKIYYDPLITTIQEKFEGYASTIPTSPPKNIHHSIMAYMDDSLWIAPDKLTLTKILQTAASFYKYNNIKVNPAKSTLLTNTTTTPAEITFDDTVITATKPDTPLKYLGTWFSTTPRPKAIQKTIIAEMKTNLCKLQFARITEKQAIYVINHVLIPRFQYRLHSSYLAPSQLTMLMNICIRIVKQKGRLARGLPNSFLTCPGIYELKDLRQAQSTTLISVLSKNLNHPNFHNSFLKLRLQQLQDASLVNTSILEETPIFPTSQLHTHTAQSILAMHELGIQFTRPLFPWPIPTTLLGTSVNTLLNDHPNKTTLKQYLNKHNITCIEQFFDHKNLQLLTWQEFHHNIRTIPRGRIPKWFHTIQDLIRTKDNPSTEYVTPNPFTIQKWTPRKKGWIITSDLTIAKIHNPLNTLKGRHYIRITNSNNIRPCPGCKLKNPALQNKKCYLSLNPNKIYNLQVDCQLTIHANWKSIRSAVTSFIPKHQLDIPLTNNTPRPLTVFTNPPRILWEQLTSENFNKKKLSIQIIMTKTHSSTPANRPVATCKIDSTTPFSCYNQSWPSS